jgi:hypothetical protein
VLRESRLYWRSHSACNAPTKSVRGSNLHGCTLNTSYLGTFDYNCDQVVCAFHWASGCLKTGPKSCQLPILVGLELKQSPSRDRRTARKLGMSFAKSLSYPVVCRSPCSPFCYGHWIFYLDLNSTIVRRLAKRLRFGFHYQYETNTEDQGIWPVRRRALSRM